MGSLYAREILTDFYYHLLSLHKYVRLIDEKVQDEQELQVPFHE